MESFSGYVVLGRVAQGSTGVVYRARHVDLDRVAAIKVLSPALRGAPGQLERMRAEAGLLAGLDDPHIVEVYDFVEEADRVWIAEQWVEGVSLERVLRERGSLSAEQSLGAVRGALMGLAYAHDRDLVHRDFSTGNVLADLAGTSMLVDFGLAAPVGSTGALGTPAFLSPEVVRGELAGKSSDVYSAAAVTFTLLTGQPPFPAGDVPAVLRAHLEAPVPVLEGFGGDLQDLLRRAMDKDPSRRPVDAAAFLAELEAAARRRFGAGWLERASLVGIVGSLVGVGAVAGGSVGAAGAAGVAAGPVAETVVVDTGTLTGSPTGVGAGVGASVGAGGRAVGKAANRSKALLIAAGAAVVLLGAGGVAVAVTHAHSNNTPTTTTHDPATSTPGTTAAAGGGGAASPSGAAAPADTGFDARGTLRVNYIKPPGIVGARYVTTPARLHVSCSSGKCTVSHFKAHTSFEGYVVRGMERTLVGNGPWVQDDGPLHACSTKTRFRVKLSIAGKRVKEVSKGYAIHQVVSATRFCDTYASLLTFTGTKIG
jgi:serine/threonine-protein kinase